MAPAAAEAWAIPRPAPTRRDGTRIRPPAAAAAAAEAFTPSPPFRRLHGLLVGTLELVLPRTPTELAAWGRLLGNCLAGFDAAVAAGRSVVVGVRDDGALVAAVEIDPQRGTIVQFLGPSNRPPAASLTAPVVAELRRRQLVAPRP